MDNDNQIPPVQPMPQMGNGTPENEVSQILMSQGSMPGPGAPQGGPMSQGGPMPQGGPAGGQMPQVVGPDGRPMVQQPLAPPPKKKDVAGLVKTIVIIFLALLAMTFICLFIWMKMERDEAGRDLEGKISEAVGVAKDEQFKEDEANRIELEKYPYRIFAGPIDYGELSFEYPKTWSVYVAEAANEGGDFNAYFNPIQVDAVGKDTINALRVTIRNKSFEDVAEEYQKAMEKKDANLTVEATTVAGTAANRYTGKIPGTDLEGVIVIFKIRDKTVIMQTDSMLFKDEFDKLLETVKFNA